MGGVTITGRKWTPPEMQDLRRYGRARKPEDDRFAEYAEFNFDFAAVEKRVLDHVLKGLPRVFVTPLGLKVLPRRLTMALLYGASFGRAVAIAFRLRVH